MPGWKESAEAMNARYPAPTPEDAVWADGIVFGTPTRFGSVASELKAYIDGLGGLWAKGALNGKAGAAFTGSVTPHGGNEFTIISMFNPMAHLGLIIVPTGYADGVDVQGRRHALWPQRGFRQSACRSHSPKSWTSPASKARGLRKSQEPCAPSPVELRLRLRDFMVPMRRIR